MTPNPELIPIFIPDEEARKFLVFQQYYEPFNLMISNGVFGVKNGAVTLHFDSLGKLQRINRADVLFDARIEAK